MMKIPDKQSKPDYEPNASFLYGRVEKYFERLSAATKIKGVLFLSRANEFLFTGGKKWKSTIC